MPMKIVGEGKGFSVAAFVPPEGLPPTPAKFPVIGDQIWVWITEKVESDDHWSRLTVFGIEGNHMQCGYSKEGVKLLVAITGPSATWKWEHMEAA